jgi:hypothetical protein
MRSVASAIEGAALNKPAKLFGRNASPNAAKAETAIPPAINRKRYSNKGVASQMMSRGILQRASSLQKRLSW